MSPLQAVLAAGVIDEERYYRALAERLGCSYYLGSPRFAENFDAVRGLRCGVAPLAGPRSAPRAVIAPGPALAPRLIEMTRSGRLRPESFAVTSPKRFAALIRAQRSGDVLENALSRLPADLSAKSGLTRAQVAFLGLTPILAAAVGAISPQALSLIMSAALWVVFLASITLRSLAAVANPGERSPRLLRDHELPTYTVVAALYRETDVVRQLVDALNALDYPKSKLDIKLVVERRDRETLSKLSRSICRPATRSSSLRRGCRRPSPVRSISPSRKPAANCSWCMTRRTFRRSVSFGLPPRGSLPTAPSIASRPA